MSGVHACLSLVSCMAIMWTLPVLYLRAGRSEGPVDTRRC